MQTDLPTKVPTNLPPLVITCVCLHLFVCVCVFVRVRVRVCACVCVCVRIYGALHKEGPRPGASLVLAPAGEATSHEFVLSH